MQTPNNKAGFITEAIMKAFSKHSDKCIIDVRLDEPEGVNRYNKIYGHVYKVLKSYNIDAI